jgi:hypothetical protein
MDTHDELRLELLRARNELTFLLSDQIYSRDSEVRNVRSRITQLLDTINIDGNRDKRVAVLL